MDVSELIMGLKKDISENAKALDEKLDKLGGGGIELNKIQN